MRNLIRNRKGQGLVEYALIIAGVALIAIVGITMFGHKVADLIGTVAAILPGAHTDDNAPIIVRPFDRNGQRSGETVDRDQHDGTAFSDPATPSATTAGLRQLNMSRNPAVDPASG